jgi:hypothetical protein
MTRPPRYAVTTAAVGLAVAWFIVAYPVVALALLLWGMAVVGFVAVVGVAGWLLLAAGVDRVELPDAEDDDALPYGGGWGG